MRASFAYISIFIALTMAANGCKSPTEVSAAPYITITASNLKGPEFATDTFQVRIYNHDFAQTYFEWDMGDNTFFYGGPDTAINFSVIHSYQKPGKYIVTVHAFDAYSNTVIASAVTPVTIDTVKSLVKIIPQFYNGVLPMNNFGLTPFSFSVKTTLPSDEIYEFWNYGDGTKDNFITDSAQHIFPFPGTYLVRADIRQKNGIYVGSDTALITINYPSGLETIKQTTGLEVYLNVDSTYSIFPEVKDNQPIAIKESTIQWNGNNFTIHAQNSATIYVDISGSISNDGKMANYLSVSVKDSAAATTYLTYGFTASFMKLIAVTDKFFIFRISGDFMEDKMHNLYLTKGPLGNDATIGNPDDWSNFIDPNNTILPQCILVLSKN